MSISKKCYVYTLAYPESMNRYVFYVGKGTSPKRIYKHEREARSKGKARNTYKCRVIRKIWASGEQVIREKLAYFETEQDAFLYEIALIFFMKGYGHLTNLTDGGEGALGYTFSEEAKQKISLARTGKRLSEETKQKISLKGKEKKLSETHRKRIGESRLGKPRSEVTRKKVSDARLGKPLSNIARKHIGEARLGKHHSEATRNKISKAHKGRVFSETHKQNIKASWVVRKASIANRDNKHKNESEAISE